MWTTLTNQPNLLSRRKELEEAYLPTRSHLINGRHLDFRHFTRPSSPLASPQSSSATSQSTPFSQSMTTIGAGNSFCYIQLKNVFKNLLISRAWKSPYFWIHLAHKALGDVFSYVGHAVVIWIVTRGLERSVA